MLFSHSESFFSGRNNPPIEVGGKHVTTDLISFKHETTSPIEARTRVVTPHLGSDGGDSCGVVSAVGGGEI